MAAAAEKVQEKVQSLFQNEKQSDLDTVRTKLASDSVTRLPYGAAITDDNNSTRAGARGPLLMQDVNFRLKMHHFDHEPIPERVVHARGAGAHGYFELYKALPEVSKATILNDTSFKTPVFVRFSTVTGSRGSADTARDPRGFAVKFYTKDGNWDLVGNNIPVFFIQDAIKFPDFVHAAKPENDNEIPQAQTAHDNFWDFISLQTESAHMVTWAMSDRAIPRSYRMMQGFGVNTYSLINAKGARTFVKFHWRPMLGVHSLVWDEANKLFGADPDFHRRDLFEAIESGSFPEWELGLQLVSEDKENSFDYDILDATKLIPEEEVPIQWIGKMTLNRNPTDFIAETEQVAYGVHNIVPGIDFSDCPLLQGRVFSYFDTNIRRHNSVNFDQLPINRPICPVMNNFRGGGMNFQIQGGKTNYYPNRFGTPSPAQNGMGIEHYAEKLHGMVTRLRGEKFADHFSQATMFYNSLTKVEQAHIVDAFSFELSRVAAQIHKKVVNDVLVNIDYELATKVAGNLNIDLPPKPAKPYSKKVSPKLSQAAYVPGPSVATRKIALLMGDGFNNAELTAIQATLKALGAIPMIVAPKVIVKSDDGKSEQPAHFTTFNCKSVIFDSVLVLPSAAGFANNGAANAFVCEQYIHYKAIGAIGQGIALLQTLATLANVKLASSGEDVVEDKGVITAFKVSDGYGVVGDAPSSSVTATIKNLLDKSVEAIFGTGGKFMHAYLKNVANHRYWDRDTSKVPA